MKRTTQRASGYFNTPLWCALGAVYLGCVIAMVVAAAYGHEHEADTLLQYGMATFCVIAIEGLVSGKGVKS